MSDICGDNRFEIIAEAKSDLLEATNINDSPEEMAVLDSVLFRCWQMGWLKKYELSEFEWCTDCKEYDQEKHCCHRWTKVIRQTVEEMKSAEPERKTGKWEVQPSTGEDRPFIWWKCSECGHVIFSETERDRREFHAFCGRCGADTRR